MFSIKLRHVLSGFCLLILGIATCFGSSGFKQWLLHSHEILRKCQYLPDDNTLGLWHFNGTKVLDVSKNKVTADVEGPTDWDPNQEE